MYMPIISYCFIGEIKSYYCIHSVTTRNVGHYFCQVKNQYGVVNSDIATVIVTTLPTARNSSLDTRFTYVFSIDREEIYK